MRRGFIIIAFIWMIACVAQKSYAISNSLVRMELLRRLAGTQEGDTVRLNILYQLVKTSEDIKLELYYINKLVKEAEMQQNEKWRAEGYLAHMYFAYNSFQPAEVYKWMTFLEPIARKEKLYDLLFLGKRCVTDMMLVEGQNEKTEKEANKLLREARKLNSNVGIAAMVNSLSNIYKETYRREEAIKIQEDNYAVILKAGNNLSLEASNSLITLYKEMDDRPNWLRWMRLQEQNIQQLIKENPAKMEPRMKIWKLMNYIHYLSYYTVVNDRAEAEKYLKLSEEYNMSGYNTIGSYYHPVRYNYFERTKQYDKALSEVEALIEINKNTSPWVYNRNYFMKAEILRKLDRFDEALDIYKQAFVIKDSLRVENINTQVNQLKNDYNANTLQLERERIDRNTQVVLLVLVIIAFVILIGYMVHTYRVRGSLRESEGKKRKMSEEMEQANLAKEHFLSSISSVINVPLNETVKEAMLLATEKQLGEEEKREIATGLNKTSAELMKLINNILDLSRLEAGMMKFQVSENEMVMLTQSLIDGTNMQVADKVLAVLPKQSFMMKIDATRYSQVINNLLQEMDSPDNQMLFAMNITGKGKMFVSVKGTILAKSRCTQEQIVVNEVNRMIIEYFGGSYEIHSDDPEPFICFTL